MLAKKRWRVPGESGESLCWRPRPGMSFKRRRLARSLQRQEFVRLLSKRRWAGIRRFRRARGEWISLLRWMSVAASGVARGQGTDIMDLSPEALKNVQVYSASMYVQSDRDAPSSVTVITADQIHQFCYRTLADALRGVRGFDVTYDRNYTYVGVGGFSRPGGYNDRFCCLSTGIASTIASTRRRTWGPSFRLTLI
jgi:hypothetical protein